MIGPDRVGTRGRPTDAPASERAGGSPEPEDGEPIGSTAFQTVRDAEAALRRLIPALLDQLREDDRTTADMLVGLLFRTVALAAGSSSP
ncbi:hypothetical protein [Kitasatospora herbaricolor]|uniref:Uncharacterized protein n=1 Tax=Kitasatospora herbaricolor TaxID=68217 RepID=A0ABZ1WIV1_9ACTN|nr:hypothetical protein [Kitasatospora herbaricolor]